MKSLFKLTKHLKKPPTCLNSLLLKSCFGKVAFTKPVLPFKINALEPYISKETLEYHYGKHHLAYFNNLTNLVQGTKYQTKTLKKIVKTSTAGIFNNSAQIWNHSFYWNCLSPNGGGNPTGKVGKAIEKSFGSFEDFSQSFS